MTLANKRLCMMADEKTREIVRMMCDEAAEAMPEIAAFLAPMCVYHAACAMKSNPAGGVFVDRGNGKIPYRNPDGYPDPTAHAALNKVKREMDEKDLEVQGLYGRCA